MSNPHRHSGSWVERTARSEPQEHPGPAASDDVDVTLQRHGFKYAHTSMGAAGHLIHMAGVFVPLIAGELVQDATKYKKTVRLASIGTALAYESLHIYKEHQREKERAPELAECRGRE